MPALLAVPALIEAAAAVGITLGVGTAIAIAVTTTVLQVAFFTALAYGMNALLGKKSKLPSFIADATERSQMVRQAAVARRLVYGTCKVSGPLALIHATGSKNENLHLIVMVAGHEVEEIGDIFLNDEQVAFSTVTPSQAIGTYAGFLRVNKHLGTSSQTADADLLTDAADVWTSDDRLRGIAYFYPRIVYDAKVFPSGLPNFSAVVRGKKVYDPRTSTTAWSDNAALCLLDYFLDTRHGLGCSLDEIDLPTVIASANVCDEEVAIAETFTRSCGVDLGIKHITTTTQTLEALDGMFLGQHVSGAGIPAGARITAINTAGPFFFTIDVNPTATTGPTTLTFGDVEKRYTLNGTVDTSERPGSVIEAMLSAMAGTAVYSGGKWFIRAGAYVTPTVTLNENDLRGAITVQTKLSRREACNAVKGLFVSPANQWQPTDFPPVVNSLYLSEDQDERLWRDVQLPYTTSAGMAQRLAKIELEKARQEITVTYPCKLTALNVMAGDTVQITNERHGWVQKPFEVTEFKFTTYKDAEGNDALGVDLVLRETAAGVYDWNDGEETTVDLAPNTNLPDPRSVPTPVALTLLADGTTALQQADGTFVPRLKVTWDPPNNIYVEQGGKVRVEYKKHADSVWQVWSEPRGDVVEEFITDVLGGTYYDVRVQFENSLLVRGAYATASNYLVPADVTGPSPVTSLAVVGIAGGFSISFVPPTNADYDETYLFIRTAATPAPSYLTDPPEVRLRATDKTLSGYTGGLTRYFWAVAVDKTKNRSTMVGPVNATSLAAASTGDIDAVNLLIQQVLADLANQINNADQHAGALLNEIRQRGETFVNEQTYVRDAFSSTARDLASLYDTFGANEAIVAQEMKTRLVADAAAASVVTALSASTASSLAMINSTLSTQAGINTATASSITTLNTNVGNVSSSVTNILSAHASSMGSYASAYWRLDAGGKVVSMLAVASNGTPAGEVGTIIFGGATLQSDAFSTGVSGWEMKPNGDVEVNNLLARGTITSGPKGSSGDINARVQTRAGCGDFALYDNTTLKAFFGYNSGQVTLDMGGGASNIAQVNSVNSQLLRAFSTADPRTIDAPIKTDGGAWIEKSLDVFGEAFLHGDVKFGTWTPSTSLSVDGYIEIIDSMGNPRKLAVLS